MLRKSSIPTRSNDVNLSAGPGKGAATAPRSIATIELINSKSARSVVYSTSNTSRSFT